MQQAASRTALGRTRWTASGRYRSALDMLTVNLKQALLPLVDRYVSSRTRFLSNDKKIYLRRQANTIAEDIFSLRENL